MSENNLPRLEKRLLAIWLTVNLCIGILIVHRYGVSFDEPGYYKYAASSLEAYKSLFGLLYEPNYGPYPDYGPAFIVLVALIIKSIQIALPSILIYDIWHYSYFLLFQLTGLCVYILARRWSSNWTAWSLLMLFITQPLLWGHAFINPKDVPFMFFFALSVLTGFRLADHYSAAPPVFSIRGQSTGINNPDVPFAVRSPSFSEIARQTLLALKSFPVLMAGIALGLTISVRVLGPLAGLIVILYLVAALKQKAIPVTLAYFIWTGIITYLTWPFLWSAPIQRFLDSLRVMANFQWQGKVLFDGRYFPADGLPRTYLPVLMNIQLTEPGLLLFYSALCILLWRLVRERIRIDLLLYVGLGFVLPLIALIALRSPLYDNFRQLLFLLPAMFLAAGLALETIFSKLRRIWIRLAISIAISLPGIFSIVQLHPYQYIYYNSLAGGVYGASGRFETDYWLTSYRELALQLNQIADQDAGILTIGASQTFEPYARPDLRLDAGGEYDYAVIPSRWKRFYPDAEVVIVVERSEAVLSTVKQIKGGGSR